MECPKCRFDNPPGMKFCGQCGERLGAVCPSCGAPVVAGFKFCGECGAAIAEIPPAPPPPSNQPPSYTPPHLREQVLQTKTAIEGERKQVTVLFCDLVSSTALADRLGPEVMHSLLSQFFELALSEVHRYEGTVNQFLGDGFMALFGAPVAHEDHARRAVLAALGLQRQLREHHDELGAAHGVELAVRMGLNTGLVVVGGIGDRLRMDYTAIGDTTNLAARLQQLAPAGAILASEATARLVEGEVALEALPPLAVKGKSEPIAAYRVLGLGPRRPDEAVLSGARLSPFVGRERELAVLAELLEQAADGQGQVVGLAGEAGSGKSRLLHEFRRRSWSVPAARLAGRCVSYGAAVPYLPLVHALRGAWEIGETDDPAEAAGKARAGLAGLLGEGDPAIPHLLDLLSPGEPGGTAGAAAIGGGGAGGGGAMTAQALQGRTFAALRQWIAAAGRGGLVILEIEDLHWADPTSEEFLSYLAEGLTGMPLLLLLTYRSGYRPRWMDRSYATQITMRRLGERESERVVQAALQRASVPAELARLVLAKAEGNPFFLEELTRSLLERGSFGAAAAGSGPSDDATTVPDTIQGVLMARIDRLPDEHKRLLQAASVLGREFSSRLLGRIWEGPSPMEPLLRELQRGEFVYEMPAAEEPLHLFKHALTQEVVYQSLLTARRQALHAAVGRALEELHAGRLEEVCAGLAHHFSQAGEAGKAVDYLSLLAEQSAARYAHAEAAKALYEALEHAERLAPERRAAAALEIVRRLAVSLLPLARFPEARDLLARHRGRLAEVDDPRLAGAIEFWLALYHSYLGDQAAAAEAAGRAIATARGCGDLETEGKARYVLARDGFVSGRFAAAIAAGEEAVTLLERSGERWWRGQTHWAIGFNQYALGRWQEALAEMAKAHAIGEALEEPRLDTSWGVGYFHATMGEPEAGIAACREALARSRDPLNLTAAQGFLGYAQLEQGDLAAAREALEAAVATFEASGFDQLAGWLATFLAEVYAREGRQAEGRERALRALEAAERTGFGYGASLARRALGRVALAAGDREGAAACLAAALAGFDGLGVALESARTRLDLAALAAAADDAAGAAAELARARQAFADLRLPRLVELADRREAELGARAAVN